MVELRDRYERLTFASPIKLAQESNGLNLTSSVSQYLSGDVMGIIISSASFQYLLPVDSCLALFSETSGES